MKLSVLQESLKIGLATASHAVGKAGNLPILSNFLLRGHEGSLEIAATNLEMGITRKVGAKLDTDNFEITVPAKTFLDFVNNLPPERVDLTVNTETHSVKVECGMTKSTIKGLPASDYPVIPKADDEPSFVVDAEKFAEAINHVAFGAAKEDNRPILTGIYVQLLGRQMRLSSADGYRLTQRTIELDDEWPQAEFVVPARSMLEIGRAAAAVERSTVEVFLRSKEGVYDTTSAIFEFGFTQINTQLIDGKYPAVDAIIPKAHTTSVIVNRGELQMACKRAEIFARDGSNTLRLKVVPGESELVPGKLVVSSVSQEKGDNEGVLDASISGFGVEIAFNVRYLMEILGILKEEQVEIQLSEPTRPGMLLIVGRHDFLHVLMPMSMRG